MARVLGVLAVISVCVVPPCARAQSSGAFAGWAGLVSTPVAGFSPSVYVPPPPSAGRRWGAEARYSHWQFAADDDNTTNLAVGLAFPVAAVGRWSVLIGRTTKKECPDCDAYMFGADLDLPFLGQDGAFTVILHPAVGLSTQPGSSDLTTFGAGLDVPLLFPTVARSLRLVPFVSPGVGLGRISAGGSSDTGLRLFVGGGFSFVNMRNRLQVTASVRRIVYDEGATVFGIVLGYGR